VSISVISLRLNLATSGESCRYVVAFTSAVKAFLPTSKESKAHFGLPWDNCGKCYMDGKRIQCLSNPLQHVPIYFNCFPVIQPASSKVCHLSTFLHIMASPGKIVVNVTWIERGFNAGQTHRSMYPSIFNHLRAIARY